MLTVRSTLLLVALVVAAVFLTACEPVYPSCDDVNATNQTCTTTLEEMGCPVCEVCQNTTCPVGITFDHDHCFTAANDTITMCISSTDPAEDAFNVEVIHNETNGTGRL